MIIDTLVHRLIARHKDVTPQLYYDTQRKCIAAGMPQAMRGPYWLSIVRGRLADAYWSLRV